MAGDWRDRDRDTACRFNAKQYKTFMPTNSTNQPEPQPQTTPSKQPPRWTQVHKNNLKLYHHHHHHHHLCLQTYKFLAFKTIIPFTGTLLSCFWQNKKHTSSFLLYFYSMVSDFAGFQGEKKRNKYANVLIVTKSKQDEDPMWCLWEVPGDSYLLRWWGGPLCKMWCGDSCSKQTCEQAPETSTPVSLQQAPALWYLSSNEVYWSFPADFCEVFNVN